MVCWLLKFIQIEATPPHPVAHTDRIKTDDHNWSWSWWSGRHAVSTIGRGQWTGTWMWSGTSSSSLRWSYSPRTSLDIVISRHRGCQGRRRHWLATPSRPLITVGDVVRAVVVAVWPSRISLDLLIGRGHGGQGQGRRRRGSPHRVCRRDGRATIASCSVVVGRQRQRSEGYRWRIIKDGPEGQAERDRSHETQSGEGPDKLSCG